MNTILLFLILYAVAVIAFKVSAISRAMDDRADIQYRIPGTSIEQIANAIEKAAHRK